MDRLSLLIFCNFFFNISSVLVRASTVIVQQNHFAIKTGNIWYIYYTIVQYISRTFFDIADEEVEEVFAEDYDDPHTENTAPPATEPAVESVDNKGKPLVHEVSACPNRSVIQFYS